MSNPLVKIEGQELQNFIKKVKEDPGVALMVQKMVKQKAASSADYKLMDAFKGEHEGINITSAVLVLGDHARIAVGEIDGQLEVRGSIVKEENGQEVLKLFRVVNRRVEPLKTIPFTEEFKTMVQKLSQQEIKPVSCRTEAADDCWYGNWCGPFCGGPGDPIDGVDSCCKVHDKCYEQRGWGNCSCDLEIIPCLEPYISYHQFARWAYYYFIARYASTCI
ncbi:MAG: hypothetical protein K6T65_03330 [Peptococcaceae bacterium]|nr:hypothetical protein [Peptococcaceae bacterium]